MNNDLISREALKKALKTEFNNHLLYLPIAFRDLIDNAPTVSKEELQKIFYETAEKPELKEVIAYESGKASAERLQGEWVLNKDKNPECPFCHHSFTYLGNFCGNCGAYMKGGAK